MKIPLIFILPQCIQDNELSRVHEEEFVCSEVNFGIHPIISINKFLGMFWHTFNIKVSGKEIWILDSEW